MRHFNFLYASSSKSVNLVHPSSAPTLDEARDKAIGSLTKMHKRDGGSFELLSYSEGLSTKDANWQPII